MSDHPPAWRAGRPAGPPLVIALGPPLDLEWNLLDRAITQECEAEAKVAEFYQAYVEQMRMLKDTRESLTMEKEILESEVRRLPDAISYFEARIRAQSRDQCEDSLIIDSDQNQVPWKSPIMISRYKKRMTYGIVTSRVKVDKAGRRSVFLDYSKIIDPPRRPAI